MLPTALFTAIGLSGLGFFSKVFFSSSIVSNQKIYGEIGVVFIILSWLIGIGVVITGGAIIGSWYVARDFSFLRWVRQIFGRRTEADGPPKPRTAGTARDGRDGEANTTPVRLRRHSETFPDVVGQELTPGRAEVTAGQRWLARLAFAAALAALTVFSSTRGCAASH